MESSNLFSPITIGSMTMKNRTWMAPMSLGFESEDGTVNETMQEYWLARAKGGVGCIILDAFSVDPKVPYLGNTLCFRSEESINSYRLFIDKIHETGAKIIPQITHPGPESISAFYGIAPLASSVYLNSMAQKTRELTLEEIPGIIECYAKTCEQAKEAGFDGIELHCAHAYMLLGSFLSPMRNKRCDAYGGCIDNRARLLFEVIDAIKARCGKDFPIILRMSGDEKDPQGNTIDDMCYLVPKLIEHGIDAFEISGGTQYERPYKIIPSHGEHDGVNVTQAKRIKEVSTVPVIVVGKILDPQMAMDLLDRLEVDGIVFGRALLADENLVQKAQEKRFDEIAPCTGCVLGCVGEQGKRRPATCVINPSVGKEKEMKITPCENKKRIAIAGGGVAGMSAARIAKMRGHEVTLFERFPKLGGQLLLACIPPHKQEISKWVVYLQHELERLNVDVKLNTTFTADMASDYDEVITATGASEIIPPIEGVDRETAITAWQVIRNDISIPGGQVIIVGGGMVGCEVSELLIHQKRGPLSITIAEMDNKIAKDMVDNDRIPMMNRLQEMPIEFMTNTKLVAVNGQVATFQQNETYFEKPFTHLIFATGAKCNKCLFEELKEHPNVHCVGDAQNVAQALEAIRDASLLAMKL